MSALIRYEQFVDDTTEKFLSQTEAVFCSKQAVCNFAEWLQWYAFDVIGEITYSKRHGFVDRVTDVDGMVNYLGNMFSYVAPVLSVSLIYGPSAMLTHHIGWSDTNSGSVTQEESYSPPPRQIQHQIIHFSYRQVCASSHS